MSDEIDSEPDGDGLSYAADAATAASHCVNAAAQSAADTAGAAQDAAQRADELAAHAKVATAATVAAAASSTAKIAATTAAAVAAEAVVRAKDVAHSAAVARERVAGGLTARADADMTQRAASEVARAVAADAVAQATDTADAAALVAEAVTAAAESVSLAARSAATSVEFAATEAAASAHGLAGSSAASKAASDLAVRSTSRFAALAPALRAVAAVRRATLARNPPLVGELHAALARAELRLHYQPIYTMDSTGALVGVEALLRWQHPSRGLLPPADFLHIAESHPGLVNPVGDWVLATAITQATAWRDEHGTRAPQIWVNVSCDQLGQQRLRSTVEGLLRKAQLDPDAIGLEVTERQLIETTGDAASDLASLREFGVPLALDDFGTGYASLDYLRRFTFDEIKIDRSFVSGLGQDRTDTAVTASIIELGRSLDLAVVAEGVETQEQYDHLKQLGCSMCQGYLLQRPAPPGTIAELLTP